MTQVLLIRHAANASLDRGVIAGRAPGVHLSPEGEAQAESLARRLASLEIQAIYASPLERTMETAQIIAAPHDLAVTALEDLQEADFGAWAGASLEDLQQEDLWPTVQFTPSQVRFPGGESPREMQSRAVGAIEDLRREHPGQTIGVVSHGDVIKSVAAFYAGLPLDMFQRIFVGPASLTILELGGSMPRLVCLNDTGHLSLEQWGEGSVEGVGE